MLPIISFAVAFAVAFLIAKPIIKYLHQIKCGQKILQVGPRWHMPKQNTPTMGGLIFIISICVCMVIIGAYTSDSGDLRYIPVILFSLLFGAIGFLDDYTKVKKKMNLGLTAMQKLMLQIAIAVVYLSVLRYMGFLTPNLYIPFLNITVEIGWYIFMPFAAFVIVGTVNSVNLTDGVDGLAAGVTLPVALFFTLIFFMWKMESMTCFAAALAGSLVAFLIYNFNPAKVFMGDTGSLFLGGAVCGMAFACNIPLVLILVGIVYIAETLSDILQVLYFKITRGKRLFKMAPLHHHFELSGWKEKKIVIVFTFITAVMCVIAYFGIRGVYLYNEMV